MPKQKPVVWVVIHCEYMAFSEHPHVDEMVFQVCSSLRAAEKYIGVNKVMSYSWWKIERHQIDVNEDKRELRIYSHTGRPIKSPPYKRALAQFLREKKRESAEGR